MYKRLTAGILVLTMVFQLCTGSVYAAEKTETENSEINYAESETEDSTTVPEGAEKTEDITRSENTVQSKSESETENTVESTLENIVQPESGDEEETENTTKTESGDEEKAESTTKSESESEEEAESTTKPEFEDEEETESTTKSESESETNSTDIADLMPSNEDSEEAEAFEEGDPDFLFQAGGFQVMGAGEDGIDLCSEEDGISLLSEGDMDELADKMYADLKDKAASIDIRAYGFHYDSEEERKQLLMVYYAVVNDHPDLYYVRTGYTMSYLTVSKVITRISPNYQKNIDDAAFQEGVQRAKSVVSDNMDDLQKAIAIHDYLVLNCEYDKERLEDKTMPGESYSAYGVLANQIAVCQGYALAYKYLMNEYGIECYVVTSDVMNHAWNIVRIGDALYQVDPTWDDPTWDKYGLVRHAYMFQSDKEFETASAGHSRHYDWYVTKGSGVVDIKAESTTYDNAFWRDVRSPLVYDSSASEYYYVSSDKNLQSWPYQKDGTGEADTLVALDTQYSGLVLDGSRLYYNTSKNISYIDIKDTEHIQQVRYSLEDSDTDKIFGFTRNNDIIRYVKRNTFEIKGKSPVYALDDSKDSITEVKKNTYTVTFQDNFGTVFDTQKVEEGNYAAPPVQMTPPDGYKFSYWKGTYSNVKKDETVVAVYTKISYTISYVLNGGQNHKDNKTKYDVETAVSLADPTKNGYDFGGWYADSDFVTKVAEIEKGSTGNRTLYAKWTPTKYCITYELADGENNALNPAEYTIETDTFMLADPARKGYVFEGWYAGLDYQTAITEVVKGSSGDLTVYAKWKPIQYHITYELDKGTNSQKNPAEYNIETADIMLAAPTRDHYNFDGWYADSDYQTRIDTIKMGSDGDISLYAKWLRKKVYHVRFWLDEENVLAELQVEEGDSATAPDTPDARTGYEFVKWDKDFADIQSDLDIKAVYTPIQYTITYELNGAVNAAGNPSAYTIETADFDFLTPKHTDASLAFGGWYADKEFRQSITSVEKGSTGNITVFAKWESAWPVNIGTNSNITIERMAVVYKKGKVQKPVPTVLWNGKKLSNKKDFTVAYADSPSGVGEYEVTVTGKGDFTGTAKTSLRIIDSTDMTAMSSVKVTQKIPAQVYLSGGNTINENMVTLKKGETQLIAGKDYEFIMHEYKGTGTHYVAIRGKGGNYVGEITTTFQVKPCPISDSGVTVRFEQGGNTQPYEKNGAQPKAVISYKGQVLTEGIDYVLSYKNNKAIGKSAVMTITGKNNFNSKRTLSFTVGNGNIDQAVITVPDKVVSKKAGGYVSTPVLTDMNGNKLSAKKDYDISVVYKCDGRTLDKKTDKVSAGTEVTAEIKITGKGNYNGTWNLSKNYKIIASDRNLSKAKVTVNHKQYYTGSKVELDPKDLTVMVGGVALSEHDYEIVEGSYVNNNKKGTAKVTIHGTREYGGTKTFSFKIYAR